LAGVIFDAAVLALVRALLPPKVGQSADPRALDVTTVFDGEDADFWDIPVQPPAAATAPTRSALWIVRMSYSPDECAVF
jgi:hypothetical protein